MTTDTSDWDESVVQACEGTRAKLLEVKQALQPFFLSKKSDVSKLAQLEKARLYVAISYVLCKLWKASLYTQGVDVSQHQVIKEEERVKTYIAKIRAVTQEEKRKATVNRGAAERLLTAMLGNNNVEEEEVDRGGPVEIDYQAQYDKEKRLREEYLEEAAQGQPSRIKKRRKNKVKKSADKSEAMEEDSREGGDKPKTEGDDNKEKAADNKEKNAENWLLQQLNALAGI